MDIEIKRLIHDKRVRDNLQISMYCKEAFQRGNR